MNFSQQHLLAGHCVGKTATVVGVGSIGSHVVNMLVRMGVQVTVYDGDSVDSHNIPPSLYGISDLSRFKVDALERMILRETGVAITTHRKMYAGEPLKGSVCVCVDTMEARQLVWKHVAANVRVDLMVDTRVSEEFYQVFAIRPFHPSEREHYEHYLAYDSKEATPIFCGGHSVSYVSSIVAGQAVATLSRFWEHGITSLHREGLIGSCEYIVKQGEARVER